MEDKKYLVRVSCMTYNHAPYIVDAMNGFCMQETDFPFVCTIMDDASTDGEQEVIKKYLTDHFDLNDQTIVRNEAESEQKQFISDIIKIFNNVAEVVPILMIFDNLQYCERSLLVFS